MAEYQHSCNRHGDFEVSVPMTDAKYEQPCPVCGAASRRVFGRINVLMKWQIDPKRPNPEREAAEAGFYD